MKRIDERREFLRRDLHVHAAMYVSADYPEERPRSPARFFIRKEVQIGDLTRAAGIVVKLYTQVEL